jgi:hypothetical protein
MNHATSATPQPTTARLPAPDDLVIALPYLLDLPAHDDGLLLVVYLSCDEVLMIDRSGPDDSRALRYVAPLLDDLVAAGDHDRGHLIAFTGPQNSAALREIAAADHPHLSAVLQVYEGRWCNLTDPGPATVARPAEPIPTDLETIEHAMLAVAAAGKPDLIKALQPVAGPVLAVVAGHLDDLAHPGDGAQPPPHAQLLALFDAERHARENGPVPLDPARAAQLLHALGERDLYEHVLLWADEGAWRLWQDLIPYAPPGWIAPVATLIMTTAFQDGDRLEAWVAAAHARRDGQSQTGSREHRPGYDRAHERAYALAGITQRLLRAHLGARQFQGFLLGLLWAGAASAVGDLLHQPHTAD